MESQVAASPPYLAARQRALRAISCGGVIAGILDGLDAAIFYKLYFSLSVPLLLQHIASGLLGRQSFHLGWSTVVLGVALHFTIATGAAAVFYSISRAIPALWKDPFVFGPAFGIAVYFVMHYVVIPLSAVTPRTVPVTTLELADQLFSHMFFVGLPIAIVSRRYSRTS